MRVNPFVFGILVLAIFMGTIVGAQATGLWSVSGKVGAGGEQIAVTGTNVEEIKGWMVLGDVAKAYDVPVEEIVNAFGLPADTDPTSQIKSLESDTFSPTNLRTWLSDRLSGSATP
jgi:hypothetical protein